MRLNLYEIEPRDGTQHLNWFKFVSYIVLTYVATIASAEGFWYLFAGGPSLLIGGYALVAATLINIRVLGSELCDPYPRPESQT
jgi:hypothetical protein